MKLYRACVIETGTNITDPSWGLYDGRFYWITGRPGFSGENPPVTPPFGQNTWKEGILAAEAFEGPELACKIGYGGYSTMGGMELRIAKPGFQAFLESNQIQVSVSNKVVRHYMVEEATFRDRGVFCVDAMTFGDGGDSLACIDIYRLIHKDVPGEYVTEKEFPGATEEEQKQVLPICLGFVNNAKLVPAKTEKIKKSVYVDGITTHTVTGVLPPSTASKFRLVVGSGITSAPNWHGLTLVVSRGGQDGKRPAASIKGVQFFSGSPNTVDVSLETAIPGWDEQFVWSDRYPERAFPTGPESWMFEVWDFREIHVASSKKIFKRVGLLKEYVAEKAFLESVYPSVSDLPGDRSGIIITISDPDDLQGTDRELFYRRIKPSLARYQGIRFGQTPTAEDLAKVTSNFPDLYDDLPLLLENETGPGHGYSLVFPAKMTAQEPMSLLVEVGVPKLDSSEFENVYLCVDAYVRFLPRMDGTSHDAKGFRYGVLIGEMANSGKRELNKPPSLLLSLSVVKHQINPGQVSPDTRRTFVDKEYPGVNTYFSLNFLPEYYRSIEIVAPAQISIPGVFLLSGNTDARGNFNVTKAFKQGVNSTKTLLVEVRYQRYPQSGQALPDHGGAEIVLSQIGYIVSRNVLKVPENAYESLIGQLHGSDWGGRRNPVWPVRGIADFAEYLIRVVDGRGDMVDTESFDWVTILRPPFGTSQWFVGRQLLERKNSADYLDEMCKNAMLLMLPQWDGKRRLVSWMESMRENVPELNADSFVEGSLRESQDSQSVDIYSEFDLNYDQNLATGGFNKRIAVLRTDKSVFPASDGNWQQYVTGIHSYAEAATLWNKARAAYLITGTPNRLTMNLPWLQDQFNGEEDWKNALASLPNPQPFPVRPAARLLLEYLLDYTTARKRVCTGKLLLTPEALSLKVGDCILLQDQILTGLDRRYGWITSIGTMDDGLPVEIVWMPGKSPDVSGILRYDDGADKGVVLYDDDVDLGSVKISV